MNSYLEQVKNLDLSLEGIRQRTIYKTKASEHLSKSLQSFDYNSIEHFNFVVPMWLKDDIPVICDPNWTQLSFSAKNIVHRNDCIVFIAKIMLSFYNSTASFRELLKTMHEKNYREFIEGGGAIYFIDNIIQSISRKDLQLYKATRIHSVQQLLWNLINEIIVPLWVEDSVYYDEPELIGGHCVILIGITQKNAIVIDSSYVQNYGCRILPVKQLFDAMIANEDSLCVWNLFPCHKNL